MPIACRALALLSAARLLALSHGARAAEAAAAAAEDGAAPVSEVIVTAPRQEEKARIVQFKAPNLISVQSAETILKYPDFNAAEALGRLPGISLSSDTGEGRFVQIRSIDANLDGFGVEGNFTYVDSHILEYDAATSLTGLNEYGMLPGTSEITWNLAAFYEAYGIETRLSGEYISDSLFGLSGNGAGGDQALDTIQDSRFPLDLTNQPLRYYEGCVNRPIQREVYDITIEGGVRAHF
jgi:hypothetical protein